MGSLGDHKGLLSSIARCTPSFGELEPPQETIFAIFPTS